MSSRRRERTGLRFPSDGCRAESTSCACTPPERTTSAACHISRRYTADAPGVANLFLLRHLGSVCSDRPTPRVMKFPQAPADIPGDMGHPGRTAPSTLKSDVVRDLIAASDAACVAGWIGALVATIEARRTHPLGDPSLQKIHRDLEEATHSCFNQVGDFRIRVQESSLFFEGECVYHNPGKSGSLSAALFRDGLSE